MYLLKALKYWNGTGHDWPIPPIIEVRIMDKNVCMYTMQYKGLMADFFMKLLSLCFTIYTSPMIQCNIQRLRPAQTHKYKRTLRYTSGKAVHHNCMFNFSFHYLCYSHVA